MPIEILATVIEQIPGKAPRKDDSLAAPCLFNVAGALSKHSLGWARSLWEKDDQQAFIDLIEFRHYSDEYPFRVVLEESAVVREICRNTTGFQPTIGRMSIVSPDMWEIFCSKVAIQHQREIERLNEAIERQES